MVSFRRNKKRKREAERPKGDAARPTVPPNQNSPFEVQEDMSPAGLMAVFQDSQRRILQDPALSERTTRLMEQTRVYPPGFQSAKAPRTGAGHVRFQESLTLLAAGMLKQRFSRVAVLNFANPVSPGGGVRRGARAQEEYLCRASNLYNSLVSQRAAPYYQAHEEMGGLTQGTGMFAGSDAVIYSPDVTVFREDVNYFPDDMVARPGTRYTGQWMDIDVLTCAAPYQSPDHTPEDAPLRALFMKRFQNILEVAMEHGAQALVLGAFGCGAFNNPPQVVAEAAQAVLLQPRYRHAFDEVVFAVKRSGWFCENYRSISALL